MGIFEKSIPKYIHNHENEVAIIPEQDLSTLPPEPYIDDIFDPLFNRSTREYLRQKYGNSPLATFEGYAELLDNTWNGNDGIFGKGMGILSTFGRSMEKADDLILGGLTEGVKGLTGQSFENPIENIFVEDQDYSGRRLLAAMANSMSSLAGGTTVDESDFGAAYTIPALGIELMTDVGIAGGALANTFAPAVHTARRTGKMTSKEILQNLGKNGASQTLGEVGQLLSDYDDLMAKAAIDITAPGLRPAFKSLRNRLAQYFQTTSPYNIANVTKHRQAPGSPPSEDAGAAEAVAQLIDDVTETMDSIPVSEAEAIAQVLRTPEQAVQEVVDNGAYNRYVHSKSILDAHPELDLKARIEASRIEGRNAVALATADWNKRLNNAFNTLVERIQHKNIPLDRIGTEVEQDLITHDFDEIRKIVKEALPGIDKRYVDEVVSKLDLDDEDLLDVIQTGDWSFNESTNSKLTSLLYGPDWKSRMQYAYYSPKYKVIPSRRAKLSAEGMSKGVSSAHTALDSLRYRNFDATRPRFSNSDELAGYLGSDEMLFALTEYFPNTIRKVYNRELGRKVFTINSDELDKIRSLIQNVYYPQQGTTVSKYVAQLENLTEYIDKYADPDKIKAIEHSAPDAAEFLDGLYRTTDEVSQDLLQPLRSELPRSRELIKQSPNTGVGLTEDYSTSIEKYVQTLFNQISPYVKSEDDLAYLYEPIRDFMEIRIRPEAGLQPSSDIFRVSKRFDTEVLPFIRQYVKDGGNPFYKTPLQAGLRATPEEWKRFNTIKSWMGVESKNMPADPDHELLSYLIFKNQDAFKTDEHVFALSQLESRRFRMRYFKDEPVKLEETFASIFDEHRKQFTTPESVSETAEAVQEAIVSEVPEQVARQAYDTVTPATVAVESVASELAPRVDSFIRNGGSEEAAKPIFGEEEWNLWKKIQEAAAVPARNAKGDRATLRVKGNVELARRFEALQGRVSEPYKKFKRYYILQSERLGDTLAGSDFWKEFRSSSMFTSGYPKGHFMIKKTQDALTRNADIINRILGGDYVEVIVHNVHNKQGTVAVTMRWNTKHSDVVDAIRKHRSELERANFEDIVFAQPRALTQSELDFLNSDEMRELDELMRELQFRAADQARTLGFVYDTSKPYTRHAMSHSPDTALYLNDNFYIGAASSDLDDISAHVSDLYGDKGVFGSREVARRFRGSYWNLENPSLPIFEYMPDRVFKSTLSDGMFANNQYQSFVDLFHNDSFKISEWFKSVDDLKEVLYAKRPDGSLSGNLQNLELVTFKTDAEGRLIGLTKFDKMSDAGLEAALKNPDTILVPAGAITHMDKLLRKDVRMGNKFWAFINKHLTIPFKFGLLANPGFLLGNVGDATLKLTTTMSEKYGTTVAEEARRTAECIATVMNTRSMYYDAFQKFLEDCELNDVPLGPEEMIPDIVAMSPKRKERFLKYLNGELTVKVKGSKEPLTVVPTLTKQQEEACRFWFMLQEMQMSSNKLREYEDLAELSHKSRFDIPGNAFDRITQGSGQYDPENFRTWGIFMNNPVMNAFTDASESWEELIRTASIVDDLRHRGYGAETFGKQLNPDELLEFDVAKVDAKNTMYNAQFDYERTNDFIDNVGKVVPFPIFFLKNFQYWMDLWMKNPQWVDNAIDVQEGLWAGREEDEGDTFATEAKGRGAIPVGGKMLPDWFKGMYKPAPLQSMFSAFSLLNSPVSDISYRLHPLIGGTAAAINEQHPNELTTSLFPEEDVKYRPYSTNVYERNVKVGDPNFNPVEYTLHRMNPFERATNTYLRTPAKIERGEQQLSDFLPSVFQPDF